MDIIPPSLAIAQAAYESGWGEKGSVKVLVKTVKERELPAVNDEFAKLASEFETIAQLKDDLKTRLTRVKELEQGGLIPHRQISPTRLGSIDFGPRPALFGWCETAAAPLRRCLESAGGRVIRSRR